MAQPKDKHIVYKLVRSAHGADGDMHGLYNSSVIYRIGKLMRQKARPDHGGGYYAMRSVAEVLRGRGSVGAYGPTTLLECEAWGTCIVYPAGKISWSNLRPLRILATLTALAIDNPVHRELVRTALEEWRDFLESEWKRCYTREGGWPRYDEIAQGADHKLDDKIIAILGGTDNGQES